MKIGPDVAFNASTAGRPKPVSASPCRDSLIAGVEVGVSAGWSARRASARRRLRLAVPEPAILGPVDDLEQGFAMVIVDRERGDRRDVVRVHNGGDLRGDRSTRPSPEGCGGGRRRVGANTPSPYTARYRRRARSSISRLATATKPRSSRPRDLDPHQQQRTGGEERQPRPNRARERGRVSRTERVGSRGSTRTTTRVSFGKAATTASTASRSTRPATRANRSATPRDRRRRRRSGRRCARARPASRRRRARGPRRPRPPRPRRRDPRPCPSRRVRPPAGRHRGLWRAPEDRGSAGPDPAARRSRQALQRLARDHEALHLGGALVDARDPGIAREPFDPDLSRM